MAEQLPPEQVEVLSRLESGREERVADLAVRIAMDQAKVAAAAVLLAQAGLCTIREEPFREWTLKEGGREVLKTGLPERRILAALLDHGGTGSVPEISEWAGLSSKDVGQSLKGLVARAWATRKGPQVEATDAGREAGSSQQADEAALQALAEAGRLAEDELAARGVDTARARELLGTRNPLIDVKDKVHRWVSLAPRGEEMRQAGLKSLREVTLLTPELLASGEWKDVRLKPYDVHLATEPRYPGKIHPLQRIVDETRLAFLEMGFEEWNSPWVESAFWDFDALFQPQDHPAREMQDTFYVERPARTPLPADRELVERVRATHENGGDTGSVGWQYRWNAEKAEQNVLRTHNTATTIRAVATLKGGPRKVFSVGRVFRREAIDYKHLPIFNQVDGIIIDAAGSFSALLGTLGAFYERMGFQKFEFRPGFFPYTEPSVEVYIWNEARRDWFEMGGAGVFRPEVTEPLGCTDPVLAWGLGLDRLAMLRHGLTDIRDLYLVDLEWLKGVPQCR